MITFPLYMISGDIWKALDNGSTPAVNVDDAYGGDDDEGADEDDEEFEGYRRDEPEGGYMEKPEVKVTGSIASGTANNGKPAGADSNELITKFGIGSTISLVP